MYRERYAGIDKNKFRSGIVSRPRSQIGNEVLAEIEIASE